ncbi:hypothetical protein BDV10DRAFT_151039 [Aspergillus recurvatus]
MPSPAECRQYAEAFFSATPFYPFISQDVFYVLLTQVEAFNETSKWNGCISIRLAAAQLLLILSLGAQFLETRLGLTTARGTCFWRGWHIASHLNLPGSVEGVKVLLLMVLHSFYNPEGLNTWYVLHTIIASCLDLGLQRRNSVMFTFRPEVTGEHKETFVRELKKLKELGCVKGHRLVVGGPSVTDPIERSEGFEFGLLSFHESLQDLEQYQPSKEHHRYSSAANNYLLTAIWLRTRNSTYGLGAA